METLYYLFNFSINLNCFKKISLLLKDKKKNLSFTVWVYSSSFSFIDLVYIHLLIPHCVVHYCNLRISLKIRQLRSNCMFSPICLNYSGFFAFLYNQNQLVYINQKFPGILTRIVINECVNLGRSNTFTVLIVLNYVCGVFPPFIQIYFLLSAVCCFQCRDCVLVHVL